MIDLHCHILPGLDDGPKTIEEALEMARIAAADGITDIVATPHTLDGLHKNKPEEVIQAVERFQQALDQAGIPLRIHPGSEVHIHVEFVENLLSSNALTMCDGKKYVLLELPALNLPKFTEDLLYELTVVGITPIIAHPERNVVLRENPNRLAEWIQQGTIAQLTAGSLTGQMGERTKKAAEYMIKHRLVHVIASDAHNTERRRPELQTAFETLEKLTSREAVQSYRSNAEAVLRGENVEVLEPMIPNRKKKWLFF